MFIFYLNMEEHGMILLDSGDRNLLRNSTTQLLTPNQSFSNMPIFNKNTNSIINKNIQKLALSEISYNFSIGNVNRNSDTFQFYSSNDFPTLHTIRMRDLPAYAGLPSVFNFLNKTDLLDATIATLNLLTGVSGLTFSYIVSPANPDLYLLQSAGGDFYFALQESDGSIRSNTAIIYGKYIWNFSRNQTMASQHVFGSVFGLTTRYVDFNISNFVEDQKKTASSSGNKPTNPLLYRLSLNHFDSFESNFSDRIILRNLRWITKILNKSIENCNINLTDEWGFELDLPNLDFHTTNNSHFELTFLSF